MPTIIKNFLNSEKGVLALALIVAASVLTGMGKMTFAEWQDYTIWIAGIYTGGKALQGAASAFATCDIDDDDGATGGGDAGA